MMVCAHGNVVDFCKERDMVICETWDGEISNYKGNCRVLVTDSLISEYEYYFLKGELIGKGVELISTIHKDDKFMVGYLTYVAERRREKYSKRLPFGYCRRGGEVVEHPESMAVIDRIIELRDAGATLDEIREDERVHHPDGRKLGKSTIQQLIKKWG